MNTVDNVECAQQMTMRFHGSLTPEQHRDRGMKAAIDHANMITDNWSEKAYGFLRSYMTSHSVFMAEQVREASAGIITEPPSGRAWGAIIVRAVKEGLISRIGFQTVKNARAHCTPAAVWKVN